MQAYLPRDPGLLVVLACIAAAQLVIGYGLARWSAPRVARWVAWPALVGAVASVERVFAHEPAGLRMLAVMTAVMLGMKILVLVEDRARRSRVLDPPAWLAFALGWPGMRPHVFAERSGRPLHGARRLMTLGASYFIAGAILVFLARWWWDAAHERWSATAIFFVGASLVVHFGAFDLLAGAWRARGVACDELFRAPWRSQSLSEFWSRRWNLAFSEMTAIAVYRPLSGAIGRNGAMLASFVVSGLLHEAAISLPVRAGFGLPTAYFALHGLFVWIERELARRGRPVGGIAGRVWTLGCLVLPLPILFHRPFLEGVVWPLVGID